MKLLTNFFAIRSRLLALVLAIFVPFLVLAAVGLGDLARREHNDAMHEALKEARLLASRVDEHVSKIEVLLLAVGNAVSVDPQDAERNDAMLRRIKSELPSYTSNIHLFDTRGYNIGTSAIVDRKTLYAGDRLYFQTAMRGDALAVGEPLLTRSTQQWVITLARPIRDASNNIVAVLAMGTLLDRLHHVATSENLPDGSVLTILNENHRVLGRSVGGPEWINRDLSSLERVAGHHPSKEVSTIGVWADGVTRITGTVAASRVPWFVSVGLPESYAVAHMAFHLWWSILLVVGALGMAIAIVWLFAKRIVQPLRQLSNDAAVLATGNLGHRTTIRSRDELGTLADTLNGMAASIQHRQQEADRAREEVAKEAEERGRLFETSLDLIFVTDRRGIFRRISTSCMSVLGYSPEEMIGRSAAEFIEPDDLESTRAEMRSARGGKLIRNFEARYVHKDGHGVTLAWTGVWSEAGQQHFLIGRDMTERKHAEDELRQAKETLAAVIDASPVAIFCLAPDGQVMVWSRAAESIFGYTAEETIGQPYKLVPPGGEAEFDRLFHKAMSGETLRGIEVRRTRKDGRIIDVSFAGAPMLDKTGVSRGVAYAFEDITERKKAQDELRHTKTFLDTVVENVPAMLFVKDPVDGRFILLNRTGEELLGTPRGEIVGKNDYDFFPKQQADLFVKRDREACQAGKMVVVEEEPVQTRHNGSRLFHTRRIPLYDDAGTPQYLLGFSEDITDRKQMREELQLTEAQLRQSQKMEAIGQLTGGLSHDLNNLLGIAIGNLDLLKEEAQENSLSMELLDEAVEACLRGAELNKSLLAFARRQPLQPKQTDLTELVGGMTKLLTRAVGQTVRVTLSTSPDLWPVVVDPAQLQTALTNLVVNARDAMPAGGQLGIAMENVALNAADAQTADVPSGAYVAIDVSDTGSGMSPEVLAHVFEPFFTTKEVGKGTGLGLSMVFGFVKQSGGHIKVYSELGTGALIRMYLPVAEGNAVLPAGSDAALPLRPGSETVLVAEDNEGLRRILVRQLKELGYTVLEAENGKTALEMLSGGKAVDLLLTDIVMPGGMNGWELARKAEALRPTLKTLFTSGFPEESFFKDNTIPSGARLLHKPYRKIELAQMLRDALAA